MSEIKSDGSADRHQNRPDWEPLRMDQERQRAADSFAAHVKDSVTKTREKPATFRRSGFVEDTPLAGAELCQTEENASSHLATRYGRYSFHRT